MRAKVITLAKGYSNERLQLEVELPHNLMDRMIYKRMPSLGGELYLGGDTGIYRGFKVNFDNRNGYGGAEFKLNMENGSVHTIKGPWSSRPYWYSQMFGLELMDINNGYMMTPNDVWELLVSNGLDHKYMIVKVPSGDEYNWEIKNRYQTQYNEENKR